MQMNRRDAIKTMTLSSAALMSVPLSSFASEVPAASTDGLAYPYQLPDLPYAYDALADFIDPETMTIHHAKHHAGYVNKLNAALETADARYREIPLEQLLADQSSLPDDLISPVINNGGGHVNHSLFWKILSPDAGGQPEGRLAGLIDEQLGGFASLIEQLHQKAMGVFGSGWAWLTYDDGGLRVTTSPNQNNPLSIRQIPLLGIDVWEHAYYLKYQNRRSDYVGAVLQHINWREVEARLPA